jgi:hypothetical protein
MNKWNDGEELARTSSDTSDAAVRRDAQPIIRSPRRGAEWWDGIWRGTSGGRAMNAGGAGNSGRHDEFERSGFEDLQWSRDEGPVAARPSGHLVWDHQPWWRQRIG